MKFTLGTFLRFLSIHVLLTLLTYSQSLFIVVSLSLSIITHILELLARVSNWVYSPGKKSNKYAKKFQVIGKNKQERAGFCNHVWIQRSSSASNGRKHLNDDPKIDFETNFELHLPRSCYELLKDIWWDSF